MWEKILGLFLTGILLVIGLSIALALCWACEDPPLEEMVIVGETETD